MLLAGLLLAVASMYLSVGCIIVGSIFYHLQQYFERYDRLGSPADIIISQC
jgi:hypothetical protein